MNDILEGVEAARAKYDRNGKVKTPKRVLRLRACPTETIIKSKMTSTHNCRRQSKKVFFCVKDTKIFGRSLGGKTNLVKLNCGPGRTLKQTKEG